MRYIRTEDNRIYEITKVEYNEDIDMNQYFYKGGHINSHEVIKQANTIEGLCDEFVLVAPYRFRKPRTGRELDKDFEEMKYFYTDKDDTIYGAIWTDKGLIYVAKMKGILQSGEIDWELL